MSTAPTALESVAWDLDPLVDGAGEAGCDRQLNEAVERAQAFAAAHQGMVAELDGPGLAAAVQELEQIAELVGRAGSYASLRFSVDTADPANGALIARVQELATNVETALVFFELEWAALDDDRVEELLQADGLDKVRHHLRTIRRYRPHLLSEPEEKLLAEKAQTGSAAWSRLFSEVTSAIRVDLPDAGEPVALDVALSRLQSHDREVRRTTAEAVTTALEPGLRVRGYIFNTLLQDKAIDDRLRRYPSWISSRNLSNEASDESVEALVEAVQANYELPRRWYRLKAQLLGLDRLKDFDRMAAVTADDEDVAWDDARDLVLESFEAFSPVLAGTARRFFDENWIDAPVRPGKRGGAFCAYTVPSVHPYVMLNYTHKRRDVLTLAHELGHGVHAALAAPRGLLHQHTPLTLAETASVFGEAVV
ncbi:MAG TPA: M3 family metallopeptidase, partial [Baekduia sp.]|nr:M3 family metallopeptidase [Baekduia sp.]